MSTQFRSSLPLPASLHRRGFLVRAGAAGLALAGSRLMQPPRALAQSGLDPGVMQSLASANLALYGAYTGTGPDLTPDMFTAASQAILGFASNLDSAGFSQLVVDYGSMPLFNAQSVPAFDASAQQAAFSAAQSLPFFGLAALPQGAFQFAPQACPSYVQVGRMNSPSCVAAAHDQISILLMRLSANLQANLKRGPVSATGISAQAIRITSTQAAVGVAAAGVVGAGGGALINAGNGMAAAAPEMSGVLVGTGIGLVAVAILTVGILAWNYIYSSTVSQGAGGGNGDNCQVSVANGCPNLPKLN